MSTFIDFLNLIDSEIKTLLDITPWYIQTIFYVAALFAIVIAIKRAIID